MAGRPAGVDKRSRIAILKAAVECFSRNGYQGTTMRDISRVSGLGQPTIYHFYGNKENLFQIALRSTHLEIMRVLRRGMRSAGGGREELLALFRSVETYHRSNPDQIHLIFRLLYTAPPEIRDRFVEKYAEDYSGLVKKAFEGRNLDTAPDKEAPVRLDLLVHVFHGYLLDLSRNSPGTGSRTDYAKLLDFILAQGR